MPQRVERVAGPFINRLLYHAVMAVVVGLSSNLFFHFTFKIEMVDQIPRFAWQNLVEYGSSVWEMLKNPNRFEVVLNAVCLYAAMMTGPLFWIKHHAVAPCHQLAGIDNPDISWRKLWIRLPYRMMYHILATIERMMIAWVAYIAYLAHNPSISVSWLKYMQNVKSPLRILSNPENVLGFTVFLLSLSVMVSVFNLMVRRRYRRFGLKGRVLK